MRTERNASTFANMSAPPRSFVTLPRLAPCAAAEPGGADASPEPAPALRDIPVGPGGGELTSNALCVARVEIATALRSRLRLDAASPLLTAHLGLARVLVALARTDGGTRKSQAPIRAVLLEIDRIAQVPEGELVHELGERIASIAWPAWAPRVAFVAPPDDARDPRHDERPRRATRVVHSPLLAARLVAAIREPVFLRNAAPTLANLLDLPRGSAPPRTWQIWLPVAPGRVRPLPSADRSIRGANP